MFVYLFLYTVYCILVKGFGGEGGAGRLVSDSNFYNRLGLQKLVYKFLAKDGLFCILNFISVFFFFLKINV